MKHIVKCDSLLSLCMARWIFVVQSGTYSGRHRYKSSNRSLRAVEEDRDIGFTRNPMGFFSLNKQAAFYLPQSYFEDLKDVAN